MTPKRINSDVGHSQATIALPAQHGLLVGTAAEMPTVKRPRFALTPDHGSVGTDEWRSGLSDSDDSGIDADGRLERHHFIQAKVNLSKTGSSALVGREVEQRMIHNFIVSQKSGALCVCGKSGTGKTASVNYVLECWRAKETSGSRFVIEVKCTKSEGLGHVWRSIWKSISEQSTTPVSAVGMRPQDCLQRRFLPVMKPATPYCDLVILDEIDLLTNDELCIIFDWATEPHSHLALIGIANDPRMVQARLQLIQRSKVNVIQELVFNPYDGVQIGKILVSRCGVNKIFESGAIELCSKKTVNHYSGDIRAALDVCARAIDLWLKKHGDADFLKPVDLLTVLSFYHATQFVSPTDGVKDLGIVSQFILASLILHDKSLVVQGVPSDALFAKYKACCQKAGRQPDVSSKSDFQSAIDTHLQDFIELKVKGKGLKERKWFLLRIDHSYDDVKARLCESVIVEKLFK